MKRLTLAAAFIVLIQSTAQSQEWKKLLSRDVVKIEKENFVYDEYYIFKRVLDVPNNIPQRTVVRVRAEAPAGDFISRDNFVGITSGIESFVQYTFVFSQAGSMMVNRVNLNDLANRLRAAGKKIADVDPFTLASEMFDVEYLGSNVGLKADFEVNILLRPAAIQTEVSYGGKQLVPRQAISWEEMLGK